jgi:ABC-type transport system involved in multi-copper enzyme maturation permease subunit
MTIKWTKVRGFIGACVAIVVLIVFASAITTYMGINVPGLSNVAHMLGIDQMKGQ